MGGEVTNAAGGNGWGNTASVTRTFKVQATSASLVSNVQRACAAGLVDGAGLCNALLTTGEQAARKHAEGAHAVDLDAPATPHR